MQISLCVFSSLLLAQFVAAGNETEEVDHRIIGGVLAKQGRYKAVVGMLVQTPGKRHFCTGTAMNNHTILTAGHCVANSTSITVYVDCVDIPTCTKTRSGTGLKHPNNKRINNVTVHDIGVVKTTQSLGVARFAPLGQPAQFYPSCTTVGFGRTVKKGPLPRRQLYRLRVVKIMRCSVIWPRERIRLNNTLCSIAKQGHQIYVGDSGGPLFCGRFQVGVTSQAIEKWNMGTKRNETIMMWMIATRYKQWIHTTASANYQSSSAAPFLLLCYFVQRVAVAHIWA